MTNVGRQTYSRNTARVVVLHGYAKLQRLTATMIVTICWAPETGEQEPDSLFRPLYDVYNVEKDLIMLEDFTEGTICQHIESSFVEDPDPGLFTAWLWAHKNQSIASTYATSETRQLRTEGYVAMDYHRLRRRYDLDGLFESVLRPVVQLSAVDRLDFNRRLHEERDESYRRRCEIYDAGGRGYWNGDDDSKLIWGNSAPGAGMEMALDSRTERYRDTWKEGILVDRIRLDDDIVA